MPEFQMYPGFQKSTKWCLRIGEVLIEKALSICSPELITSLGKICCDILFSFYSTQQRDDLPYEHNGNEWGMMNRLYFTRIVEIAISIIDGYLSHLSSSSSSSLSSSSSSILLFLYFTSPTLHNRYYSHYGRDLLA